VWKDYILDAEEMPNVARTAERAAYAVAGVCRNGESAVSSEAVAARAEVALEHYSCALIEFAESMNPESLNDVFNAGRQVLAEGGDIFALGRTHHEAAATALANHLCPSHRESASKLLRGFCAACPTWYDSLNAPSTESDFLFGQLQVSKAHRLSRANSALRHMNEIREQEALRIARELHDEAGQLLASVHLAVESVAQELPDGPKSRLRSVRGMLDDIEHQLRRLSHELRPAILDDLGLTAAIGYLKDGVAHRTGIRIEYTSDCTSRLPIAIETALYRVAQEGLNNAAKHARPSLIRIELRQAPDRVSLTVRDNGVGFSATTFERSGGLGLIGIQERLDALGGTFSLLSNPNEGTVLTGTVPLA
jgi:signal transduction histidine kinase